MLLQQKNPSLPRNLALGTFAVVFSATVNFDDKDPVWMNDLVKSKIKSKNILFKQCVKNGRFESDFLFLESIVNELNELISSTKTLYYENLAKKLNNPLLQIKTLVNFKNILQ